MGNGFRTSLLGGIAAPPYTNGPYTFSEDIVFSSATIVGNEGDAWFVDGTNGLSTNTGKGWSDALNTIQAAVTLAGPGDNIYITAKDITDFTGDPTSYEENIIIPPATSSFSLIGVSRGRTQGGLPQLKDGTETTAAILTIRAPGCLIANLGFNGSGNTGGGILLDADASTKDAAGTSIIGCHFKNCKGSTATSAVTGGAIMWSAEGMCWQTLISGNRFYRNVADIVVKGSSTMRPQDCIIENNVFTSPGSVCDCNLFLKGTGSGVEGFVIRNNVFPSVPSLGGTNDVFIDATGSLNCIMTGNTFGTSTTLTFGAAGSGALIPTTMLMTANFRETTTGVNGEVFRT